MQYLDISFFIGFIIGCPLITFFANKIGKKVVICTGLGLLCSLNVLILYVRHFSFLFLYQFVLGLEIPMTTLITYMWLTQIVPSSYRPIVLTLNAGLPGLYFISVSLLFKQLQDWRLVQIFLNFVAFTIFICIWFHIPEDSNQEQRLSEISVSRPLQTPKRNWLIYGSMAVVWYLASFLGSGMAFTSYHFNGDLFVNSVMIGLADSLSAIFAGYLSVVLGSKTAIVLSSLIGVIGSVVYIHLGISSIYIPIALFAISFGGQATDAMLYSLSAEQVPHEHQGGLFSITGTFSRVGMLSATIIASYVEHFFVIFVVVSVSQFLFALFLRDSRIKSN